LTAEQVEWHRQEIVQRWLLGLAVENIRIVEAGRLAVDWQRMLGYEVTYIIEMIPFVRRSPWLNDTCPQQRIAEKGQQQVRQRVRRYSHCNRAESDDRCSVKRFF
jgi:hypothetical protein